MTDINHKFFREKFYECAHKTFDIVSTIDHPYTSPPIRLIDGHRNLKILNDKGIKSLVCILDDNAPHMDHYRYELAFDTGILSIKDEDFFIFSDKFLYVLQKPKCIDFQEVRKRLQLVLEKLYDVPKKSKTIRDKKFIENFEKIAALYAETINHSHNGTFFYQNLMNNIYHFIGLSDLANFTADSFFSYFSGPISREWIPYCIQETKDEVYGFFNLSDAGLFKNPSLRTAIREKKIACEFSKKNINTIVDLIKDKTLIPSYQVFLWTLFLADIKHFGNDHGFFDALNKIAGAYHFRVPENLQTTEHNKDSVSVIQFEKDKSFSCYPQNGGYVIKKKDPVKNSRIASIPAIYCHVGDHLNKILMDIFEQKAETPEIIKMGIVYGKK